MQPEMLQVLLVKLSLIKKKGQPNVFTNGNALNLIVKCYWKYFILIAEI